MKDVYPVASCEISLAGILSNVEFDMEKIVDYLRSRDFTDEQISGIQITAAGNHEEHKSILDLPVGYTILGFAIPDEMRVTILPAATSPNAMNSRGGTAMRRSKKDFDAHRSAQHSKALAHEIEHLKIALEENNPNREVAASAIGATALLGASERYHAYLKEAEEIRCREAEANAPHDLIKIEYRGRQKASRTWERSQKVLRRPTSRVISSSI